MRVSTRDVFVCLFVCACCVELCRAWAGHTVYVTFSRQASQRYCCRHFWGWCTRRCHRSYTVYWQEKRCQHGWKHKGDQNCIVPICNPSCANGGRCRNPNDCWCPTTSQGPGCRQLTCSYRRPCFPGDCQADQSCRCEPGFSFSSTSDGCINFNSPSLKPKITKSTVTLAYIRRTDNRTLFNFILDGTDKNDTDVLWSNQHRFNNLGFELESLFTPPDTFPLRPVYVHDSGIGIVDSYVEANVSKVNKHGSSIRDAGSFKKYSCGFSSNGPENGRANCYLYDDQFKTLIEHGDWLNIRFFTKSGGFQTILNTDNNRIYTTKHYRGYEDTNQVEFRFDFIAPKHCSQPRSFGTCPSGSTILEVEDEFTQNPIKIKWVGWADDLSGLEVFEVEVFRLGPSPALRDSLTELSPLGPVYTVNVPADHVVFPQYTPTEPGMYSVLMTVRDEANNSRIARRLVLYDNASTIELRNSSSTKLYISSAAAETNYTWQPIEKDGLVTFVVNWTDHFINRIHTDGKLLDKVAPYPIQFEEIKDDNILFSRKFVASALDDRDGNRTVAAIPNVNGLVKFEILTDEFGPSAASPNRGWQTISPLAQTATFQRTMVSGDGVQVTLRATDAMSHVVSDVTTVKVDSTAPRISSADDSYHRLQLNVNNGTYNYTSRVTFAAKDAESGVFRLDYMVILHLGSTDIVVENSTNARTGRISNFDCHTIDGVCYLSKQILDLDNCLFMVNKDDLDTANATVVITAYNQAMLHANTTFEVGRISRLKGLEKYSGPTNIRIEQATSHGFRVAWDLPEKSSCYGLADVVISLYKQDGDGRHKLDTYYATGSKTFLDVLGLNAVTSYNVTFGIKSQLGPAQDTGISLAVRTPAPEKGTGVGVGAIIGVAVGVLVAVAIAITVFIVLVRRGVIHPRERAVRIRRAVTKKYRQTVYGDIAAGRTKATYDNRQSELYIYGEMDLGGPQIWELGRDDVVLETLLKTGSFASIYKAQLKRQNKPETVVAKTLKENYSTQDELLMRAKINFSGTMAGDHPNVLRFIGAVTDNEAMGPFIIYEFCENGTLRDYVAARKDDVTMELQENMFRFGLEIARGMAYLASRQIVHRRLAARNILLTFLNEVKIAGFGPQPADESEGDADQGKRERIPIKWMAPECMKSTKDATEQSDVWSYAVVLWEIFALGEAPYSDIRGRDLPAKIKKGTRLSKPEACDDTWYGVMTRCWALDASKRPHFSDVTAELDNLFVAAPGDDYYYYKR